MAGICTALVSFGSLVLGQQNRTTAEAGEQSAVVPLTCEGKRPLRFFLMEFQDHLPRLLRRFGVADQIQVGVVDRPFVGRY